MSRTWDKLKEGAKMGGVSGAVVGAIYGAVMGAAGGPLGILTGILAGAAGGALGWGLTGAAIGGVFGLVTRGKDKAPSIPESSMPVRLHSAPSHAQSMEQEQAPSTKFRDGVNQSRTGATVTR